VKEKTRSDCCRVDRGQLHTTNVAKLEGLDMISTCREKSENLLSKTTQVSTRHRETETDTSILQCLFIAVRTYREIIESIRVILTITFVS